MTMSEYEERFRSQAPSLHQTFAASRGPNRGRRRSRHLWVAAALAVVIAMACKIASHQTVHSGTGDGLQADFLSEGRCGAVLLAPVMSIQARLIGIAVTDGPISFDLPVNCRGGIVVGASHV